MTSPTTHQLRPIGNQQARRPSHGALYLPRRAQHAQLPEMPLRGMAGAGEPRVVGTFATALEGMVCLGSTFAIALTLHLFFG